MKPATQTDLGVGVCQHDVSEPIANYGGDVIAWRCSSCTLITAHHGACDNCKAHGKLPRFERKARFCSNECQERHGSRVAKERAEARREASK